MTSGQLKLKTLNDNPYFNDDSNNLMIFSPSSYSDENRKEGESRVEKFDFESINTVYKDLLTMIPIQFGDD